MSGKIEISRELAEQALRFLMSPGDGWEAGQIAQELRALLAAPVVERQEPAAWLIQWSSIIPGFQGHREVVLKVPDLISNSAAVTPLYASPPAPVSVVLDERAEFVAWVRREWPQAPLSNVRDLLPKDDPRYGEYCDDTLQRAWVGWQARACLDKVKELNQ